MLQIYTVYVYEHVAPPTHTNPSSPVVVRELITNMHNVVVPLIDNPTVFRDPPPATCVCREPGRCARAFVHNYKQSST